ncbi:GNAT family N-acetyltransferase [Microcystis aeruginosa]|jgi:ribosomal protein S18 acetylase RimI-like enzyme|nr:GNAT family N-acetyltransferase [Microcystis aeruginosa]
MKYINFKILKTDDAENMSRLLLNSSKSYIKYFHPFDFQPSSIKEVLSKAEKDKFFGLEVKHDCSSELAGFYMLRGIDEGYAYPMYGVFISHQYSSQGIASLTISHAECFCKLNIYERLLLKVNKKNIRAKELYESLGFKFMREETSINNIVLYKDICIKTNPGK